MVEVEKEQLEVVIFGHKFHWEKKLKALGMKTIIYMKAPQTSFINFKFPTSN